MASAVPSTLLQLRLFVGFLGERSQFGWWLTEFYSQSSEIFLQPVFTATTQLARYQGVVEAARRVHDEHLSSGSYHLFRLPEEVEQDLHLMLQNDAGRLVVEQIPQQREHALAALSQIAGSTVQVGTVHEGPVAMGSSADLRAAATCAAMASAYHLAFSGGRRTYPYLVAQA